MDSRANAHAYNNPKWLLNNPIDLSNKEVHICLVNGKKVMIKSFGDVYLKFDQGSFIIRRVTCVTKLSMDFISVVKLHEEGCKILFDDHITIMRENATLGIGMKQQGLFELFPKPVGPRTNTTTILELEQMITQVKEDRNVVMWHKRLAHMKLPNIYILINSHYLYDMKMVKKMKCADCKGLKPHTCPLATRLERATKCMECVHIFIYGPHHIVTRAKQRYMICFIDEYSGFRTINFIEKFIEIMQIVEEHIARLKCKEMTK